MLENKKELPETTESSQQSAGSSPARRDESSLRDMFNRFLEEDFFLEPFDFTRNNRLASLFNRQFIPRVDVSETNDQVKVVADLPGIDPDNIDIGIEHNRMSISGRTERESAPDERPYRYERTYGEFRREFTLPTNVKKDEIRAVYKDGLLTVTLPKAKVDTAERIRIERQ